MSVVPATEVTEVAKMRGETTVCKYCHNAKLRAEGRHTEVSPCIFCFSSGYVSKCLPCKGEGQITKGSVWDGGATDYKSVCSNCGGKGLIPSRESLMKPHNGNGKAKEGKELSAPAGAVASQALTTAQSAPLQSTPSTSTPAPVVAATNLAVK